MRQGQGGGVRGWNRSLRLLKEKRGGKVQQVCVKTLDGSGWKHNAQMRCSLLSSGSQGCAQEFSLCLSPCVCLRQCKRECSCGPRATSDMKAEGREQMMRSGVIEKHKIM